MAAAAALVLVWVSAAVALAVAGVIDSLPPEYPEEAGDGEVGLIQVTAIRHLTRSTLTVMMSEPS